MDKSYMDSVQNALVHTYNPAPVILEYGKGAYLYDTEGKAYLDFAAGYAVNSLVAGNKERNEALNRQRVEDLNGLPWKNLSTDGDSVLFP